MYPPLVCKGLEIYIRGIHWDAPPDGFFDIDFCQITDANELLDFISERLGTGVIEEWLNNEAQRIKKRDNNSLEIHQGEKRIRRDTA
jgi:hypothetical protein